MREAAPSGLIERVMSRRARELGQGFPRQTSVSTPGLITLSSGTPDFPVPPHVLDGARRALDRGETAYTPWTGIPELRRAIAAKLAKDNGIAVDPDSDVLVTTGTQEALQVVCQALLDPGDEILVSAPYYDEYRRDALLAGARLVSVPSREADDFAIDAAALAAHVTERTKAVIVISPSNPTGAVQSRRALEHVAKLAVERNLVVIADELYEKFVYEDHRHHSIAAMPGLFERTVTINGFSKAFAMTGFRVGYIAAPAEFVRAMLPIKHSMTICAPSVSQWAAVAALTGPQDWFDGVLAEYDRRRRMWMDALKGMGLTCGRPQGAYYVYLNVGATGLTAAEFGRRVREEYRLVIGSGGRIGPEWDSYVRGSLAVPTDTLRDGLARLADAVHRYRDAGA